ncbi:Uncharacterised protein [Neisseria meningitidis]|nr:Uncharacterised protein [Neisseria meningitidis]
MKPMKLRLHLNFENRHNLLCNPFEHSGIKAGGFYIQRRMQNPPLRQDIGMNLKSDRGGEPQTVQIVRNRIHLVLQYLRESFSLR